MGTPHPMLKEQPPANPSAARFFIDLLTVVQEKTEGRRSEAETQELNALLYQLRMRALDLKTTSGQSGSHGA